MIRSSVFIMEPGSNAQEWALKTFVAVFRIYRTPMDLNR